MTRSQFLKKTFNIAEKEEADVADHVDLIKKLYACFDL